MQVFVRGHPSEGVVHNVCLEAPMYGDIVCTEICLQQSTTEAIQGLPYLPLKS